MRDVNLDAGAKAPSLSSDGMLAAAIWANVNMANVAKGSLAGSRGGVQLLDLATKGKSVRWEVPVANLANLFNNTVAVSPAQKTVVVAIKKLTGPKSVAPQLEFRDARTGKVIKNTDWPTAKEDALPTFVSSVPFEPAASASRFLPFGAHLFKG